MPAPRVSVVIPARNAEPWIGETLASASSQQGIALEIVLVDDGSDDGTVEVARRVAPSVRVLQQDKRGASYARNAGTAVSSGEFLLYLDADDVLTEDTIRLRLGALDRSGAGVAYCDWVHWERAADGVFREGRITARTLGSRPDVDLLSGKWWPPGALLYRRDVVRRAGSWREDLPVIQDARFFLDAAATGAPLIHVPHVGLRYRVTGPASLSRRNPRAFLDDCYRNAQMLEEEWRSHGALDPERRSGLVQTYGFVARSVYEHDRQFFDEVHARILTLDPHFAPDAPASLRVLSRVVGYPQAERIALMWRRLRGRERPTWPTVDA